MVTPRITEAVWASPEHPLSTPALPVVLSHQVVTHEGSHPAGKAHITCQTMPASMLLGFQLESSSTGKQQTAGSSLLEPVQPQLAAEGAAKTIQPKGLLTYPIKQQYPELLHTCKCVQGPAAPSCPPDPSHTPAPDPPGPQPSMKEQHTCSSTGGQAQHCRQLM
jgi:hypothetical protein